MTVRTSADDARRPPGAQVDREGEALVDALAQSAFAVMGVLTRIGAENDLSLTQLRVLGILRDRRPRMAELADFLGLDRSTMSGLVDRAEQRGLLGREKNPDDRRATDVFMTDAGLEAAERLHALVRQALAPYTGRLDRAETRALTRLLDKLNQAGKPPTADHADRPPT